jgi:hypothetical protein
MRKLLFVLPLIAVTASGCASAQAKGKLADMPALNVPAPPPRIIEPAEVPPEAVGELPPVSPAASRSPRPASPKPEPPKAAEPKAGSDPIPPVEPPPPTTAPPTGQLRTPQTADASGAAKAVRTTIDTAQRLLNTVNYAPLSNERKKAYNDAKLFIQQAGEALKQANFVEAQAVANKAETLAKELAGR